MSTTAVISALACRELYYLAPYDSPSLSLAQLMLLYSKWSRMMHSNVSGGPSCALSRPHTLPHTPLGACRRNPIHNTCIIDINGEDLEDIPATIAVYMTSLGVGNFSFCFISIFPIEGMSTVYVSRASHDPM